VTTGSFRRVSPVLVIVLTAIWLLLNQTLAPGHVLLGLALSALLAWFGADLRPVRASFNRADRAAGLFFIVLWDILRSNFAVARIVLGLAGRRQVRSGFLEVPLDLRNDHALAVLACIVTSTPGTVWAGLSPDRATLTLHVLDLRDEGQWIETIKRRYERRLMEIFR
jgi:multicomponent K+:H+ antiporter subunit E